MDKKEIIRRLEKEKEKIKAKGVKKLGLFGSYVKGKQRKDSDVDLLIKIDDNLSLIRLVEIKLLLEKIINKEVDLVEYDTIHPLIKKRALMEQYEII